MVHPTWPLYDLAVRTPRLELRLATEDEWVTLLADVSPAIYERTGVMPFGRDWPAAGPEEAMQYRWRLLAEWTPDKWQWGATVFVDGRPVGVQGVWADRFAALRSVSTGSWLIAAAQGQGIGREMRIAILHFAFAGLGALEAHSGAHVDNAASNAVSQSLGYEITSRENMMFGDVRSEQYRMLMRRNAWEQHPLLQRNDIEIVGLDVLRDWFIAPAAE